MKQFIYFLALIVVFSTIGCSKTAPVVTPQMEAVQILTGNGNRVWKLQKIFEGNSLQTLTNSQTTYAKTYYIDSNNPFRGTFTDTDCYRGSWSVSATLTLSELIYNSPSGAVQNYYAFKNITAKSFEITFSRGSLVFYAD